MAVQGASSCPRNGSVRKSPRVRQSRNARGSLWRRALVAAAAVVALPGLAGPALALPTHPLHRSPEGGFEELMVPSSMGPVKVQVQWAKHGGDAALYLLDGLRARDDFNAWTFETNALAQFAEDNITLVMPVGGQSSFYTDWRAPSSTNGQKLTYRWETFLTEELPAFLEGYGVSRTNDAVAGLSMGGSAALALAAYHRDQFKHASSFSGYLNISAPGMREAIRIAMLDAGRFNVDSMAWPWSPAWLRMDPFVFAPQLRNLPMFISASWGVLGAHDNPDSAIGLFNTVNAVALEALSMVNTISFMARMNQLGIGAHYSLPMRGTHSWGYWQDQLATARPDILAALGV
ncbi:alpha/beta hydrolase [Nocardia seriolae]|uniref:Diacylglycerol O-acyltransferase n=1 Tax=Nocardia seriolae TaxID=37332 RepID=A0ABC8ALF5_9NOCA|nr:Diacylglycerol O-acyltransferase [Nocardia seriolae]PSK30475.1 esterase family protein [Nocardia seriolae]QOW32357.1 esterase family protein [Nocardia seriolae]QUN19968.1 esterase family protein [Nocardia seriolae]